jgi:GT2 family glycosyltransferase
MNGPDLSIVLVNWNTLALTSAALASIRAKTTSIAYETIAIDNGSHDGSASELPARFPWITLVANPDNRGFSRASNQGIRLARGRYVLLLNTDTLQIVDALGAAVRYMDAHREVGALGILHLDADAEHRPQRSSFAFPDPWSDIRHLVGLGRHAPADVSERELFRERDVDWVCGSFLLMRRECLRTVADLDERFFVYAEDIDWCRRAWRAGWTVRFWPGVAMVHVGAAAHPHMRDKTFAHVRSHLSYLAKNHSVVAVVVYYLVMSGRLTGATLLQAARYLVGRASRDDVAGRFRRQLQFMRLAPGREGC